MKFGLMNKFFSGIIINAALITHFCIQLLYFLIKLPEKFLYEACGINFVQKSVQLMFKRLSGKENKTVFLYFRKLLAKTLISA